MSDNRFAFSRLCCAQELVTEHLPGRLLRTVHIAKKQARILRAPHSLISVIGTLVSIGHDSLSYRYCSQWTIVMVQGLDQTRQEFKLSL